MERREHVNRELGMTGKMSVEFDIFNGRIHAHGDGFWSHDQAVAFFEDWKQIVIRIHAAGCVVSAFVDMNESGVQRANVAELIATVNADLYREGDMIAIVVPNSLTKMQMRRVLDTRYHDFFISHGAAETWLASRIGDMSARSG